MLLLMVQETRGARRVPGFREVEGETVDSLGSWATEKDLPAAITRLKEYSDYYKQRWHNVGLWVEFRLLSVSSLPVALSEKELCDAGIEDLDGPFTDPEEE